MDSLDNNISRELIIEINHEGWIIKTTNNCYNILGYSPEEMTCLNIYDLILDSNIRLLGAGENNVKSRLLLKNKGQKYFDLLIHPVKSQKNQVIGAKISIILNYSQNFSLT